MRLACSECEAIYETGIAEFSMHGRQVRCSNCGHTWHQMPETTESARTTYDRTKSDHSTEIADPQLRGTSPSPEVLKVLREEADRETSARREDAKARSENSDSDGHRTEPDTGTLPQLSHGSEGDTPRRGEWLEGTAPAKPRRRGEILISCLMVLAALMAVLVYSFAPQIAAEIPQAEPQLIAYVDGANKLRAMIHDLIDAIANWAAQIRASTS